MFKLIFTFLFVAAVWCSGPTPAPRVTVNLDEQPEDRWKEPVKPFLKYYPKVISYFRSLVPGALWEVAQLVATELDHRLPAEYAAEIKGLYRVAHASYSNITLADIALMNIIYDLTAGSVSVKGRFACTSIVAQNKTGGIIHGRNLDYSGADYLRDLTVQVDFTSGGKVVYTGTTYMGYVGLLTAQRPNGYTISIDERNNGTQVYNIIDIILEGKKINYVAFLVRQTVSEKMSFGAAIRHLANAEIIAPVYIIVGGMSIGEGVVLTRGRTDHTLDWWFINEQAGRWYVLETNYDHWLPVPKDDNRRGPGEAAMNKIGEPNITPKGIFSVLSTKPVLNSHTTYTAIMSAGDPELYHTEVRHVE